LLADAAVFDLLAEFLLQPVDFSRIDPPHVYN
jgi:hypothetical protein